MPDPRKPILCPDIDRQSRPVANGIPAPPPPGVGVPAAQWQAIGAEARMVLTALAKVQVVLGCDPLSGMYGGEAWLTTQLHQRERRIKSLLAQNERLEDRLRQANERASAAEFRARVAQEKAAP